MNFYELMLIFDPLLGEEKIDQILSKIEEKAKNLGAQELKIEKWGAKRLANTFKKNKKLQQGYYVLFSFDGEPAIVAPLQAYLKVTENIIRYAIYQAQKKEALPEIKGAPLENVGVLAGEPVKEEAALGQS